MQLSGIPAATGDGVPGPGLKQPLPPVFCGQPVFF
ncbi:hypothetical protein EPIR_3649 [Erwinia piriflorinigrans CFBP 5888]|uniref:Uncharacterized protein n=1 Tax=Erwinia piriflorinigrans CFBP 5888 TaxID=1161919 RepID=V5ZD64_9GAMM|nr:hypothetical protein EPIR_3649 [Erwinia piriflorinigrans CFBP 5888]